MFGDKGRATSFNNDQAGNNQMVAAGEVIDVVMNDSHDWLVSKFGGAEIGYVKVKMLGEERERKTFNDELEGYWIPPLNKNIASYPLKGEIVLLVRAPNLGAQYRSQATQYYWVDTVQMFGDTNVNAVPNISFNDDKFTNDTLGETFSEKDTKPTQHYEGDTIVQGRFDNSIRLGSTQFLGKPGNTWSTPVSSDGDPIMIISNGHADTGDTHIEDVNDNDSTMMLTSTQKIDLQPANSIAAQTVAIPTGPVIPMKPINAYFGSPQVIINSDRLIFNAKKENIIISAKKEISLSTSKWKLNVSALADIVLTMLQQLVQETHPTPCGMSGPPVQAVIYSQLQAQMEAMKQ
jgi:hypothetical protein|tara:strand:+ start:476 stop:1519 length:1044 start_codon:yes stop_codon:yes gene_type:complete